MSETPSSAGEWEMREPPDYDLEPTYPEDKEGYSPREYLDGTAEHDLFKDVVSEAEGRLEFRVPTRLMETLDWGVWALDVFGRRDWFKEHDDYGAIRFTQSGKSFWVPHLYAFEDTNEDNMPVILDRERVDVTITMTNLSEDGQKIYPMTVELDTQNGHYGAEEDIGFMNPDGIRFFKEFVHIDGSLVAQDVVWPHDANVHQPNHHLVRTKAQLSGTPFGDLWVPVELLRSGAIDAKIYFPLFRQ